MFNSRKRLKKGGSDLGPKDTTQECHAPSEAETPTGDLPLFEILEPRVLYSADALGVSAIALPDESPDAHKDYVSSDVNDLDDTLITTDTPNDTYPLEIVFIDSRVPDANAFVNEWAGSGVQFVVIDADDDALEVINNTLQSHAENGDFVETVRIVSHGSAGSLQLGNTSITEAVLTENAVTINAWSDGLTDDADIFLFGCNVGEGEIGLSFLTTLSDLSGADIAASDDVTGHHSQSGDWDLEVSIGATAEFDASEFSGLAEWTHSLAIIVVDYQGDDYNFDAATITIGDLTGNYSLRAAIAAANNTPGDDTIQLTTTGDRYEIEDDSIDVGRIIDPLDPTAANNLTIENTSGGDVIIDQAGGKSRLFTVDYGTLTINGNPGGGAATLTLQEGDPINQGGAIYANGGTELIINEVDFLNNEAFSAGTFLNGGAIFSYGAVTINDSTFTNNNGGVGGAIHAAGSILTIEGSTFTGNGSFNTNGNSQGGAAIYSSAITTITDTDFTSNISATYGGAVYGDSTLTIDGGTFEGNSAQRGAGVYAQSNVDIANARFEVNTFGGAVYSGGTAQIESSLFNNNHFNFAGNSGSGGVYAAGSVTVNSSTFTNNYSAFQGGAVSTEGVVTITDSHFQGNSAVVEGGAVYAPRGGSISSSSFVGNYTEAPIDVNEGGAAIAAGSTSGNLDIERVTFSGNTTNGQGTIKITDAVNLTVSGSTFADNNSGGPNPAAIHNTGTGTATVSSSVFSNNTIEGGGLSDVHGVTSGGFNLFETAPNPVDFPLLPTDLSNVSADLQALAGAVGTPVLVRPLGANSAAINSGTVAFPGYGSIPPESLVDSQGVNHGGMPDIGASEYQGTTETIYWADDEGNIWRSNTDFTNAVIIVANFTSDPTAGAPPSTIAAIAVDLGGHDNNGVGKLYWVEQETGFIFYTSLDGTISTNPVLPHLIIQVQDGSGVPVDSVTSIAVDPDKDRIYVTSLTNGAAPAGIRVWEMGDGNQFYVTEYLAVDPQYTMNNPRDIYFSPLTGRLYWTEGGIGINATIHSMYADGTDHEILYDSGTPAANYVGITMDNTGQYLYFTDSYTMKIIRLDLNSPANTIIQSPGVTGVSDLSYIGNTDQIAWINPTSGNVHVANPDFSNLMVSGSNGLTTPTAVTAVASQDPANISFVAEAFTYDESTGPVEITTAHLILSDQEAGVSPEVHTFTLVSEPAHGGVLLLNGVPLVAGQTFTTADLTGNLTYENDSVSNISTDVFQLELTNAGGSFTTPVKAFTVTLYGTDDQPTIAFTGAPYIYDEDSGQTASHTLQASDFTFVDEELADPDLYTLTAVPPAASGVVITLEDELTAAITVLGVGDTFTQADLDGGRVSFDTDAVEDVAMTPVDDLPVLTINQTVPGQNDIVSVNENEFVPLTPPSPPATATIVSLDDEEGDAASYYVIDTIPECNGECGKR